LRDDSTFNKNSSNELFQDRPSQAGIYSCYIAKNVSKETAAMQSRSLSSGSYDDRFALLVLHGPSTTQRSSEESTSIRRPLLAQKKNTGRCSIRKAGSNTLMAFAWALTEHCHAGWCGAEDGDCNRLRDCS
jgi:hypothetical protein